MQKKFILNLILVVFVCGCTKDDICEESAPTTPLLVIEFRDALDRNQVKAVNELNILLTDDSGTAVFGTPTANDTLVRIPLNTEATFSEFQFIVNSTDTADERNVDIVTFNYTREDVYINRACAFRVTYNDLNLNVEDDGANTNWILDANILKTTIEDETEAHITIFH